MCLLVDLQFYSQSDFFIEISKSDQQISTDLSNHSAQAQQQKYSSYDTYSEFSRQTMNGACLLCLICCVSVQGLHPLKDPVFVVFEGESFRDLVNLVSRC